MLLRSFLTRFFLLFRLWRVPLWIDTRTSGSGVWGRRLPVLAKWMNSISLTSKHKARQLLRVFSTTQCVVAVRWASDLSYSRLSSVIPFPSRFRTLLPQFRFCRFFVFLAHLFLTNRCWYLHESSKIRWISRFLRWSRIRERKKERKKWKVIDKKLIWLDRFD